MTFEERHAAVRRQLAEKERATEERRRSEAAATFVPDPGMERLVAASAADPTVVERLGLGLTFAIYRQQRQAAISAGRFFDPDHTED